MAGYDGFSMSNNARRAYEGGELPASKAAQEFRRQGFKGCTSADVRAGLIRSSWHHTSKQFNSTDFYSTQLEEGEAEALAAAIATRTGRPLLQPLHFAPEPAPEPALERACNNCGRPTSRIMAHCPVCAEMLRRPGPSEVAQTIKVYKQLHYSF